MGGFTSTSDAVAYAAGGGGVSNTSVMFSIVKTVDGDAANLVGPGTQFQVEVQVEGEDTTARDHVHRSVLRASPVRFPTAARSPSARSTSRPWPVCSGAGLRPSPVTAWSTTGDGTFSLDPAGGQTVALVLTNAADAEPQFRCAHAVTKAIAADSEAAPKDVVYGFEVVCTGATYAGEAAAG